MKTAKEYYTDVFEGIRLSVCGLFGLLASLVVGVVELIGSMFNRRGKKKDEITENAGSEEEAG